MISRRACTSLLVFSLAGVLAGAAQAQDSTAGGQQPGPGGRGGRMGRRGGWGGPGQGGGMFGGRFGGPFGQGRGGQADRNPLVSHAMQLLNRADVQNDIHLDLKQKQALQDTETQAMSDWRQQRQQMFQSMRQNRGQDQTAPQDRTQRRQQMREQMQQQQTAFQTQLQGKVDQILRPDQVRRLHELDLQWRGPLAVADPKVADELQISQEHRAVIATLANDYLNAQRQARMDLFRSLRPNRRQPGQGGQPGQPDAAAPATPPTPEEMQSRFEALQRSDAAARKTAEEKALAELSPDERARWTAATGSPFVFERDLSAQGG